MKIKKFLTLLSLVLFPLFLTGCGYDLSDSSVYYSRKQSVKDTYKLKAIILKEQNN